MASTTTVTRALAWITAICLVVASALYVALVLDLVVPQPPFDPNLDFVDQLIAGSDYLRQQWWADMASSLLFAVAFAALAMLGWLLGRRTDPSGAAGGVMVAALLMAGIIGIVSQLLYVGAREVMLGIAYCDCGYKVEEVIAQNWAMWLIEGAVSWLTNGVGVLLLVGVAAAGLALGQLVARGWQLLSWLIVIVLAFNVIVGVLLPDTLVGPLLVGLVAGILVPIWLVWLALRLPPPEVQTADDDPTSDTGPSAASEGGA